MKIMFPISRYLLLITVSVIFQLQGFSQNVTKSQYSLSENDLTLSNELISSHWLWNGGNVIPKALVNKKTGEELTWEGKEPSFVLSEHPFQKNISIKVANQPKTFLKPAHLSCTIINQHEGMQVKRVYSLYPESATISVNTLLKYKELALEKTGGNTFTGTEEAKKAKQENTIVNFGLASRHWNMETIEFKDITDENNNLVVENNRIPFRYLSESEGNLLLATNLTDDSGFFILKEGPNTTSQINYLGYDFKMSKEKVLAGISGFPKTDTGERWIEGYVTTIGLGKNKQELLNELKHYTKHTSMFNANKHNMVMMNTWGDRGRDGKINEKFILNELEVASDLGITHYQIDDGWENGLSANSAQSTGNLWDAWSKEDWEVNKERFPNGLNKVVKAAKKNNIQLGLWFHPSNAESYKQWEQDADIIVDLNKKYGINYIKIDGIKIKDKQSEINLQKFFDKVKNDTNGDVFFNLDLTAGVRGGYFMYRNLGNLFLENRYTDWTNYYPYQTLRNVWMLSEYFPADLLQIEFLNNERNKDLYGSEDKLAPGTYPIEYLFATTMAAQPLAWFEATGLTEKADGLNEYIHKYNEIQADFHAGKIVPIGDEPNGSSVTGFQSIKNSSGYLLVFRELNNLTTQEIQTHLAGKNVSFEVIMASKGANDLKPSLNSSGLLTIDLPNANNFVLLKYKVK